MTSAIAEAVTVIITACGFGSVVIYAVLKSKLITPDDLKNHCHQSQAGCRPLMCQKIEVLSKAMTEDMASVRSDMAEMDACREQARRELSEQLEKIHTFMGHSAGKDMILADVLEHMKRNEAMMTQLYLAMQARK